MVKLKDVNNVVHIEKFVLKENVKLQNLIVISKIVFIKKINAIGVFKEIKKWKNVVLIIENVFYQWKQILKIVQILIKNVQLFQ